MPGMRGDHLTWMLFWIGAVVSIAVNLGTGVLLAVTVFTLQLRRDLQEQLDEISTLAHQTFDEILASRFGGGSLHTDAGRSVYLKLWQTWRTSRRTLHFALSKIQWEKLVTAIDALRQLRDLYVDPAHDSYWKRYEITVKDESGQETNISADFEEWATHHKFEQKLADYREFTARKDLITREIDYLLFYNPEGFEEHGDPTQSPSLPTELEAAWDFMYLFPLSWKWFATEVFARPLQMYEKVKRR